ncbi:MAG: hypothetical protein EHM48_10005 [Planctomycetaceae bacterium]|nr:MAG: hypothetical protein EHM48_10005 [Planctomycetaceae bacterium]
MVDNSPQQRPSSRFWQDASGRLTYMVDMNADRYKSVCNVIVSKFGLKEKSAINVDPLGEIVFQEFESDGKTISLDWDIWSGFMVTASTSQAEELVQQIETFIDSELKA